MSSLLSLPLLLRARRVACGAALMALAACAPDQTVVQDGLTGVKVTVRYQASLGLDQLLLRGQTAAGQEAFAPGVLPETPRALTSGEESLVVLLPELLASTTITLRVDGLAAGQILASEQREVLVRLDTIVETILTLGAPARCGDGAVREPLEACDDGDTDPFDGCDGDCRVEPNWECSGEPSVCTPTTPLCADGLDNDGDGYTDLADPGCNDAADPYETNPLLICDNGIDDDADGRIDYRADGSGDSACASPTGASELSGTVCNDGLDNDNDGAIDYRVNSSGDPGCASPEDLSERSDLQCDNGVDDDGDGAVDLFDPGCDSLTDADERGPAACDNGVDDDLDGLVDYTVAGADPGCSGPADTSERGSAVCDDGQDNDGDGAVDYRPGAGGDPGCVGVTDGSEREAGLVCDDGLDNDNDGLVDFPADPGCAALLDPDGSDRCPGGGCPACDDSLDNDGDTQIDFNLAGTGDLQCDSALDPSELAITECNDGLDNDGDGYVDHDGLGNPALVDLGCTGPTDASEWRGGVFKCDNGKDDDKDGLIDMADPGCAHPWDDIQEN